MNAPKPETNRWLTLLIVLLGFFMILIDTTIVNVSIPTIIKDLNANLTDVEWIISGYSLTYAALLITFGRLGDLFGRRMLFMGGLVVFTVASFFSGEAANATILIIARLFQGLGAAMLSPATLSIISSTFTGRDRSKAFGAFGAVSGIAAALGPIAGGWLTTYHSWRWIFRVNIPIGIFGLIMTLLYVKESKAEKGERVDIAGMVTSGLGFFFLVFGLIEGQNYGWLKPAKDFAVGSFVWSANRSLSIIPICFVLSIVLLGLFILIQLVKTRRATSPAVDISFFHFKTFRYGLVAIAVIALGEFSTLFTVPIFLQSIHGFTPLQSGYASLPLALSTIIAAPLSAILVNKLGTKWIITAGITLEGLGIFLLGGLNADTQYRALVPALILLGFGLGLAIAQNTQVILSEIDHRRAGSASGVLNTIRQVGTALGIAIIGAALAHQASIRIPNEIRTTTLPGVSASARNNIALAASKNTMSYTGNSDASQYVPPISADVAANSKAKAAYLQNVQLVMDNLVRAIHVGLAGSIAYAIRVGALFMFIGALLSLLIPNVRPHPE